MSIPAELKSCPLFFEMYEKEIKKIVKKSLVSRYEPSEVIVHDGEEGDQIFVVLDGMVEISKCTDQGVISIARLRVGDVFGEMVLLDERVRSADITAATECHILELSYADVFDLYRSEPTVFGLLMLNLSRMLARRLRMALMPK